MTNAGFILLTLSVLSTLFFAFIWYCEWTENKVLRSRFVDRLDKLQIVVKSKIDAENNSGIADTDGRLIDNLRRLNDLEREKAALKAEVAEGLSLIQQQVIKINQLRGLLAASQNANRYHKKRK